MRKYTDALVIVEPLEAYTSLTVLTCGHSGATFALEGNRYCPQCAHRAWQHFLHRGHADEPSPVAVA